MQTVPDIPDAKSGDEQACGPGGPEPVEQSGLRPKKRVRFPVIRSSRPGSLVIDNETIYDFIDFP